MVGGAWCKWEQSTAGLVGGNGSGEEPGVVLGGAVGKGACMYSAYAT